MLVGLGHDRHVVVAVELAVVGELVAVPSLHYDFQRFEEELLRVGILVRLQVKPAPPHAYVRIGRGCRNRRAEGPVGALPVAETPERLRLYHGRRVEQQSPVALGGGLSVRVAEPATVLRCRAGMHARRGRHPDDKRA